MANIGTQFLSNRHETEFLYLPFVPTETRFERSMNWAELSPAGMSGTLAVYTQGGSEYTSIELFLNDLAASSDDTIVGQHLGATAQSPERIEGVQGALEWFETVRKGRMTNDGVHEPPATLWIHMAGRNTGLYVIRNYSARIVSRWPRTFSDGRAGQPNRATVRMELIGYNQIPRPTAAYRW